MHLKYKFTNFLYNLTPWVFAQYRALKNEFDPNWEFEKDKASVRVKHNSLFGWKEEKSEEGIRFRNYSSYQEYVDHQAEKFNEMLRAKGAFTKEVLLQYRKKFYSRFVKLSGLISKDSKILCLGARQGTEVEVLRDLGYKNSIGLDLNPGPSNKFVLQGDFMNLEELDDSVDFVYSNAVDHAFDLDTFFKEHARVLKPGGYAMYDIAVQEGGAFEAIEWETPDVLMSVFKKHFSTIVSEYQDRKWQIILLQK